VGRDINRHYYSREEVLADMNKPVVQRLIDLMRFRNSHLAFGGSFTSAAPDPHLLTLSWGHQAAYAQLEVDLLAKSGRIIASAEDGGPEWVFELK
jgi:sucrose phosphorylase